VLGWLCFGLVLLLVCWVVFGIIRAIGGVRYQTGPDAGPAPRYGFSSGGGGFLPALLGGMFGATTGKWIYDQLFRADSGGVDSSSGNRSDQ
jgi:hypothetical protein